MPRNKDRKRIIRNRMKKTGESYTAARAHVISKSKGKQPPEPTVDYAATMPHRDIATIVHGKYGVGDWWAQAVTVGYERITGLRDRGQRRGGSYEANKSRTFNVGVDALFRAWADDAMRRRWLDGVNATVRTATAPKGMRLQWPDGAIITVWFTAKGRGKSAVALAHTKLPDRPAADKAKKYWTDRLDALASLLGG